LTPNDQTISRRRRIALGLGVIATSLLIATAIVGVGFAGGSISAAQYQYGKITICHHTHSKKHPWVTIRISQRAWPAHQRHGDTEGACTAAQTNTKSHGKGKGHAKGHDSDSTTTTTSTTTTSSSDSHGNNGKGNGHHK
jgi:hypothetical protein